MSRTYPPRKSALYDQSREALRPVFGLDIDGTLGAYHEHFTNFASSWLGRDLPPPEEFSYGSFASHLGLSKTTYRKIKLAYRRGGLKRSMPVLLGAGDLASSLRKRGALVVLCTTRPYLSLENIDEDTRHWARRNKIEHDLIIWGEHKYRDLARFGTRIVGVLEDEPQLILGAESLGLPVMVHSRPYNSEFAFPRVRGDLATASRIMHSWLDKWEGEYL